MNLIQCQRPNFIHYGRVSNLQAELDRLFETATSAWTPLWDVHEDKNKFTVHLELPGLKREDMSVQLENGELVIAGERKCAPFSEDTEVHQQERYHGKFNRSITLPADVQTEAIKATYQDGILTVTLPKTETAKPKQIDVSVN